MNNIVFLGLLSTCIFYSTIGLSQQFFTPLDSPTQNDNCYGEVIQIIPATYRTETVQHPYSSNPPRTVIVPAEYKEVVSRVLIRPAYRTNDISKMKFETVEVKQLVQAKNRKVKIIPATYDRVLEKIIDQPSYTEITRELLDLDKCFTQEGIPCFRWVERTVPATYRTISKQVVKTPEKIEFIDIPAQYETIETFKPLNADPNGRIEVPAEYKTFKQMIIVVPTSPRTIETPPDWKVITRKLIDEPSRKRIGSIRIVCKEDYPTYIPKVKQALKDRGYEINRIDAEFSVDLKKAILRFQEKQGPRFFMGQLGFQTMKALGVK